MKILYYDCFAGISGDMNLAAMLGLGVDPAHLRRELSRLGLDHEFALKTADDARNGICGLRVDVVLADGGHAHDHVHPDDHDHGHEHAHPDDHEPAHGHAHDHGHAHPRHHAHGHDHAHGHGHEHGPHRTFRDIAAIIAAAGLDPAVAATSLAIFRKVAEAEGKVHGKPADEVHFHEVGAVDSIVDIVGAAICYHALGVDAVWASPVELGGGFVRCAHGLMPVPAPATAEILAGVPTTRGAVRQEATTPTGAAILAVLVDRFVDGPGLVVDKTAYGIGHRQSEIPNVLRAQLARPAGEVLSGEIQAARLLQCNIDDMTGEMLGVALDVLMAQGAMDVHFTPIVMKKNRPATCLSLLCATADEARFKDLLFRHTTTLGIKSFPLEKTVLETRFSTLETPLGPVSMKHAVQNGRTLRSKPELEDCRALAALHGIPVSEVYAVIGKLV